MDPKLAAESSSSPTESAASPPPPPQSNNPWHPSNRPARTVAIGATGDVIDTVVAATTGVADHITSAARGAAKSTQAYVQQPLADAGHAVARPIKQAVDMIPGMGIFSPSVELGEGGDFGRLDPTKDEVILRIEITSSGEVKAMGTVTWMFTIFAVAITILLIVFKTKSWSEEKLRGDTKYFIVMVVICSIFLLAIMITLGIFMRRRFYCRHTGMVWSRRRRDVSNLSIVILLFQFINLATQLAGAAYSASADCNWQTQTAYSLGFVQWTAWNCMLFTLVVLVHNGCPWTGRVRDPKAQKTNSLGKGTRDRGGIFKLLSGEKTDANAAGVAENAETGADIEKNKPLKVVDARLVPIDAVENQTHGVTSSSQPGKEGKLEELSHPPQAAGTVLVMDAPFTVHLPKLIMWAFFEATLITTQVKNRRKSVGTSCLSDAPLQCGESNVWSSLSLASHLIMFWAYFSVYVYYSWRTEKLLASRSYREMRMARMVVGVQREQIAPVFAAFAICATLFLTIDYTSCWTFVMTWEGIIPLQALGTMMASTLAYYFMPKRPESIDEILQAWLHEFAWTEAQLPKALALRNAKLAGSKTLSRQPMFCMETAIKLLYFAKIVYNIDVHHLEESDHVSRMEAGIAGDDGLERQPAALQGALSIRDSDFARGLSGEGTFYGTSPPTPASSAPGVAGDSVNRQLQTELRKTLTRSETMRVVEEQEKVEVPSGISVTFARSLYNLDHAEVILEAQADLRALLAWGGKTLVISFRGTSSFSNAMTDIKFFKKLHPPRRSAPASALWGLRLIQVPVRVHKGFLDAYMCNGYDQRILQRVTSIINSQLGGPDGTEVLITGHSLGGALAALAAHAIKSALPSVHMTVYTYGQPRVGNVAFALEYASLVPNHFAVVNGQDPVTRIPTGWYKRIGERALLDDQGNVIVSPSYLEMHLLSRPSPKVEDHKTASYRGNFVKAIKAQFTGFAAAEGRSVAAAQEGALELARTVDLNGALIAVGLEADKLADPEVRPMLREEMERLKALAAKRSQSKSAASSPATGADVV